MVDLPPRRQPNTDRKPLKIDTNCLNSEYYGKNNSLDSVSTGSSVMQMAVDDDPYSSSFFLASSKASMIDFEDVSIASEDKEMTSPLRWEYSAEDMSRYCSTQSSLHARPKIYDRSASPSPDSETAAWHESCRTLPKSRTPATPSRLRPRGGPFISSPELRQRRIPRRRRKGGLWSHFSRSYFIRRLLPRLSRLGLHFRRLRRRHRQGRLGDQQLTSPGSFGPSCLGLPATLTADRGPVDHGAILGSLW
ncbi:hypothetical protein B0H14DRAFT_3145554, partial [Mycena olivaceomarginata]